MSTIKRRDSLLGKAAGAVVALLLVAGAVAAVLLVNTSAEAEYAGWSHWGGDAASSRYAPLDQINGENFEDLAVAWIWHGDNFGPSVDFIMRSTPIYAEGKLFTVAGQRRTGNRDLPDSDRAVFTDRSCKRLSGMKRQISDRTHVAR